MLLLLLLSYFFLLLLNLTRKTLFLYISFFSHYSPLLLCYNACNSSAKVILHRSFMFSKKVMETSYLSGIVTRIFSTIMDQKKIQCLASNLTLFAMVRNLSTFFTVSNSIILYNSNSLIKFSTYIFHLLHILPLVIPTCFCCFESHNFDEYYFWNTKSPTNKHVFAFAFAFLTLPLLLDLSGHDGIVWHRRNIIIFDGFK